MGLALGIGNGILFTSQRAKEIFLLDEFPNPDGHSYSLRKLKSTTISVVRVRRSIDNLERDFTASEITNGTLLSFTGAGVLDNGFVTTWYDQSQSNDLIEIDQALQPVIVEKGVLLLVNGKPCVEFIDSNLRALYQAPYQNAYNLFMVNQQNSIGFTYGLAGGGDANSFRFDLTDAFLRGNGADISYSSGFGIQNIYTNVQSNGFFSTASVNGIQKATGVNGSTQVARTQLGRSSNGTDESKCKIQEFVLYLLNSPIAGPIEENINSYYSIY